MRANQQTQDGSSIFTASAIDSDSDEDEGFAESGGSLQIVHKFIERIQDKLCIECKINTQHSSQLQMLAQSTIHQFEDEYKEIQRALSSECAEIRKPVDHAPKLLPQEIIKKQIEAYLIGDNKEFGIYQFDENRSPKESLLPAEGTLFLTNYRLFFHGTSTDHESRLIIRTMPVASIMKAKSFTSQFCDIVELSAPIYHLQVRSASCEFFHVVFNCHVTDEDRDQFNSALNSVRFGVSPLSIFAFAQTKTINRNFQSKQKNKLNMKGMTLGLKGVTRNNRQRVNVELPSIAEQVSKTLSNKNTLEKFSVRACRNDDFGRLGLTNLETSNYRMSKINKLMLVCKTYPAISIQPVVISDDVLRSIAKESVHHENKKKKLLEGIFFIIAALVLKVYISKSGIYRHIAAAAVGTLWSQVCRE